MDVPPDRASGLRVLAKFVYHRLSERCAGDRSLGKGSLLTARRSYLPHAAGPHLEQPSTSERSDRPAVGLVRCPASGGWVHDRRLLSRRRSPEQHPSFVRSKPLPREGSRVPLDRSAVLAGQTLGHGVHSSV